MTASHNLTIDIAECTGFRITRLPSSIPFYLHFNIDLNFKGTIAGYSFHAVEDRYSSGLSQLSNPSPKLGMGKKKLHYFQIFELPPQMGWIYVAIKGFSKKKFSISLTISKEHLRPGKI